MATIYAALTLLPLCYRSLTRPFTKLSAHWLRTFGATWHHSTAVLAGLGMIRTARENAAGWLLPRHSPERRLCDGGQKIAAELGRPRVLGSVIKVHPALATEMSSQRETTAMSGLGRASAWTWLDLSFAGPPHRRRVLRRNLGRSQRHQVAAGDGVSLLTPSLRGRFEVLHAR
jgi:hypothetical protein